ncbi:hypothetical protein BKA64DRAFT_417339 [Cadophora sp. MPI-SDFR-AT-0126]|nr:hypothetical protein BKA64DRAFT_417339 [Leotiomycetes sp. MPI-SDFR-AT-0126]
MAEPLWPASVNAIHPVSLKLIMAKNDSFLDSEANVNGIWSGIFNEYFHVRDPGTWGNSYLLGPEGQAPDGNKKLRADILITKLVHDDKGKFTGELYPVLQYEGKGATSRDGFNDIQSQMNIWFVNAKIEADRPCWGVGAKGRLCWFFYWDGKSPGILPVELNAVTVAPRILSSGKAVPTYDLVDHYLEICWVVAYFSQNPWWRVF